MTEKEKILTLALEEQLHCIFFESKFGVVSGIQNGSAIILESLFKIEYVNFFIGKGLVDQ